jgi:hypothetical protein
MLEDDIESWQESPAVVTVTGAEHVTEPPGPVAVRIYVVELATLSTTEPPDTGVTLPMPLLIEAEVAFVVDHVSVVVPGAVKEEGEAESVQVGAFCVMTCLLTKETSAHCEPEATVTTPLDGDWEMRLHVLPAGTSVTV